MAQLPLGDQDGIKELLNLGVACLGVGQDFANELHGAPYLEGMSLFSPFYNQGGTDHLSRSYDVE